MVLNKKKIYLNLVPKVDEDFIRSYDQDSNKGYILEVGHKCPKGLHKLHGDLPLLPERMKDYGECKKAQRH